ncbi:hypothetical protein ACXO6A_06425, partial [Lactobacillus delbrueckii subsp. bulgaricus]|nr:hypothetical protein [Lactobacillus delbrueckii subsp. bulgaricus]
MRGLKGTLPTPPRDPVRRIPHGMRGLKEETIPELAAFALSHPAWDAWIERRMAIIARVMVIVASRMGCVD